MPKGTGKKGEKPPRKKQRGGTVLVNQRANSNEEISCVSVFSVQSTTSTVSHPSNWNATHLSNHLIHGCVCQFTKTNMVINNTVLLPRCQITFHSILFHLTLQWAGILYLVHLVYLHHNDVVLLHRKLPLSSR